MRRGIGLRGYAQQDPLNEFRKEAFRLYEELSGFIRHQVASTIFRVNIQTQPHVHTQAGVFPMAGPGQAGRGAVPVGVGGRSAGSPVRQGIRATAGPGVSGSAGVASATGAAGAAAGGLAGQQARPGHTPSGAKIGRNDACWCGSGLKYKKCHGR
jgi:preprotein translocase subunit SecA